jgi:ferredoxin-NADP reductase
VTHAVTITLGYAWGSHLGIWSQLHNFLFHYPDVLMAMVGLSAIVAVAVTSIRAARRALRYETWWFVHLYAYLGVALAFAHQLAVGSDFADDALARAYWVGLYVATALVLVGWRWIGPVAGALRHRMRVVDVIPEGPGVVTIVLSGRRLDRLRASGGQFFLLRFLRADRWWKAHPFSLSAAPDGRSLRFTVKALGDDSQAMQSIPVGTAVLAEGPYGAFTSSRASRRKVALIGGGIGITPIRALFEEIDRQPGEVTVLYRARNRTEAIFHDDLVDLGHRRGFDVLISYSQPFGVRHGDDPFEPAHLQAAIPDVEQRDVFVCGPASLLAAAAGGLRGAGVPPEQIHLERFDY